MLFARLPMIVLTLLFGLVVLAFARDLAGPVGGLVALAPVRLLARRHRARLAGHARRAGGRVPADVGVAGVAGAAPAAALPRRSPGVALGAALATRMSALPAVPVLLLLVVLSVWYAAGSATPPDATSVPDGTGSGRRHGSARVGGRGRPVAVGGRLAAVAVAWCGPAISPSTRGLRWTPPDDLPDIGGLRGLVDLVAAVPGAVPGRDARSSSASRTRPGAASCSAEQYPGSLWYYLPAALLVKTPLGMLALWLAGAVAMLLAVRRLRPAAPYLLLPPAVLLASAA